MRHTMTEAQYIDELEIIFKEVNTVIECFYTYIEIYDYATKDRHIYRVLNDDPTFWTITLYSLQTAFFIGLGRIFDNGKDSHSIHKLLTATVSHSEFFSKEALSARKTMGGTKSDWLDTYLTNTFEPQVSDLRHLKKALSTHRHIYDASYAKIRNSVVAHKILGNNNDVAALFDKTLISEIEGKRPTDPH